MTRTKWQKVGRIVFSDIGLLITLVAYSALGAWVYEHIEGDPVWKKALKHEARAKSIESDRKALIRRIMDLKENYDPDTTGLSYYNARLLMKKWLDQYQFNITVAVKMYGYDGTVPDARKLYTWTLPNALLFVTTILTTIGYGHIFPKSQHAQMFTLPYACFGIPLTLMVSGKIGVGLKKCLQHIYRAMFWSCSKKRIRTHRDRHCRDSNFDGNDATSQMEEKVIPLTLVFGTLVLFCMLGGLVFSYTEGWSRIEAIYFTFVTLSTLGFGDYVPAQQHTETDIGKVYVLATSCYVMLGLAYLGMGINALVVVMVLKARQAGRAVGIHSQTDADGDGIDDTDEALIQSIL